MSWDWFATFGIVTTLSFIQIEEDGALKWSTYIISHIILENNLFSLEISYVERHWSHEKTIPSVKNYVLHLS